MSNPGETGFVGSERARSRQEARDSRTGYPRLDGSEIQLVRRLSIAEAATQTGTTGSAVRRTDGYTLLI
jgi:hypothetical protein